MLDYSSYTFIQYLPSTLNPKPSTLKPKFSDHRAEDCGTPWFPANPQWSWKGMLRLVRVQVSEFRYLREVMAIYEYVYIYIYIHIHIDRNIDEQDPPQPCTSGIIGM